MARAYRYLGDLKNSVKISEKVLNIDPNDAFAYSDLAKAYYDSGNYDKAIFYATKFIELNPTSGWGYELLAKVYKKQGSKQSMNHSLQKAEDLYNKRLAEGSTSYYRSLSWLYSYYDLDPEKALKYAKEYIKLTKRVRAYDTLAWAYYKNHMYKKALESLTKTIDINPNNAHFWYRLGVIYKSAGNLDSALQAFSKALTLGPKTYHGEAKEELSRMKK